MAILRPTESFVAIDSHGTKHHFGPGDLVDASSWVVKGREALFEPAEPTNEPAVEQATAAPGEKRTVRRPHDSGPPAPPARTS